MTSPALGYLIKRFPHHSQTFIATEIRGLEQLGIELRIFSYKRPHGVVRHDIVQRIHSPITYLPDPLYRHPLQLLRAHLALRRSEPERYRSTLRYVLRHSMSGGLFRAWREFARAGYLATLIKKAGVTHIHAHMAHTATQVTMLVGMLTRVPYSFTAHAYDIFTAKPADLRTRIDAAEFVVTCTRSNLDYLERLAGSGQSDKIRLHYHGVDLEKFSATPHRPNESPPLILAVGRLVEKKGFPDLLQACALLKARGKFYRCLIIGEGPDRKSLTKLIKRLGLEGIVDLPRAMSQEELIEVYRQATIFALPCRVLQNGNRDGIPNVLLEAMAVGIPVVSSAVSGIPELIASGEDGLLVPERGVEELAEALEQLLDNPALRARLASNARATVFERFDARAHVRALACLFREPDHEPPSQIEVRDLAAGRAVAT